MANATVTLRITGESGQLVGVLRVAKNAIAGVATESKKAGDTGAISLRRITKEAGGMQNAMAYRFAWFFWILTTSRRSTTSTGI